MAAMGPLLTDWTPEKRAAYGREIVRFKNRVAETGLFTDEALAQLIDEQPRNALDICTMRKNPPPGETWIAGEAKGLNGAEILEAVKRGALWVSARRALATNPRYRPIFEGMVEEFSQASGMRILSASASVLMSGPNMGIFFHCDPAETMLWHVRGTKQLNIYPRTDDYIPEQSMEAILLKENLSEAPWRDEMASGATPIHMQPGDSVCWPLHGPHNVLNGPDLNVSVSVEYSTPQSALTNGVIYTNGWMRRRLGLNGSLAKTPKALRPAWWAAARALKVIAPPKHNAETAHVRQFDVDLSAPDCLRWREGYAAPAEARAA
jgi:hypothetical protein